MHRCYFRPEILRRVVRRKSSKESSGLQKLQANNTSYFISDHYGQPRLSCCTLASLRSLEDDWDHAVRRIWSLVAILHSSSTVASKFGRFCSLHLFSSRILIKNSKKEPRREVHYYIIGIFRDA
mmetsp:Transcript_12240/g.17637  ORF Transcript_12240/g.17637 Transcript_12240/m.17637 type:complete len:124 (+) Transcript_12240:368-739(+)